jgi:uncharacterized membrane protein YhaH (DUF805 family)
MSITDILGFRGRFNRTSYALSVIIYGVVLAAFLYFESTFRRYGDIGAWGSLAVLALMFWILIASLAKRFHDIGQSGWMTLLVLVPVVGQFTPIIMLFYPGNPTDNEYGPRPTT